MSENKSYGQIQIADEVIGMIAVTAALEAEGVAKNTKDAGGNKVVEFFGKKGHTKCLKITREGNEVALELDIIVNFGTKVQKVAEDVQQRVKTAVETMTGMDVSVVNISISGIVKEKAAKAEEEE